MSNLKLKLKHKVIKDSRHCFHWKEHIKKIITCPHPSSSCDPNKPIVPNEALQVIRTTRQIYHAEVKMIL